MIVLVKTARLKSVLAARLFDPRGRFLEAFPAGVLPAALAPPDLAALHQLQPASRFQARVRLADVFAPERKSGAESNLPASGDGGFKPLLAVNVPLHDARGGPLLGVAQFIIEGESLAAEFARLERHLTAQALAAFGVSGSVLAAALGFAFRRLRQAHRELERRTDDLVRANQDLALAAKTSALGAVSAHLIHGLKNPLAGLQSFVTSRPGAGEQPEADWRNAAASTRRMQSMIAQVVSVLREEETATAYEVTLEELADMVAQRLRPLARERGVTFDVRRATPDVLPGRAANLLALILENLGQNALQATPPGRRVELVFARDEAGRLTCEMRDEGAGLPESVRRNLFAPCASRKEGGSGIGLAISRQLALHLGATLELRSSSPRGCVFTLTLAPHPRPAGPAA